jgi:tetraacyldisaccharide 4'-kinase
MKTTLAERIRTGETITPPLSWLLSTATLLTRAGMGIRKMRPFVAVEADVISVGNITAGGTGKTPAVIRYANKCVERNLKVGILTQGYGTPQETPIVVSTDIKPEDYSQKLGDEPAVILRHVPEAIIFKSKDRVHAAQIAVSDHQCDVLILDDGYQYVHLGRNDNILMIDSANPFGNRHVLPRGFLREPLTEIARATHVIVTRCEENFDRSEITDTVRLYNQHCTIEWTRHSPTRLLHLASGEERPLDFFSGKDVVSACAIGNPEAFVDTLKKLDMKVVESHAFTDHTDIPTDTLKGSKPVIITEKDAVRISDPSDNLFALVVELESIPITN